MKQVKAPWEVGGGNKGWSTLKTTVKQVKDAWEVEMNGVLA